MGRFSLRVAECRGVAYVDVERSRRAISDARHESVAQHGAKELFKQGLSERNGMIAFGRIRERFGKTAGVAKLSDVFQIQ